MASYALLLLLLCKETGLKPGTLTGHLVDVHMYEHHREAMEQMMANQPYELPTVNINNWTNIWEWDAQDVEVIGYKSHEAIRARVSV